MTTQKYCVNQNETIKSAISIIHKDRMRCALVLNDQQRLVGVFSEGDVIRILLKGIELHTPLNAVISPSFHYLKEKNMLKAYKLVKKEALTLIPIIDDDFRLIDVITILDVIDHLHFEKFKKNKNSN